MLFVVLFMEGVNDNSGWKPDKPVLLNHKKNPCEVLDREGKSRTQKVPGSERTSETGFEPGLWSERRVLRNFYCTVIAR